MKISGPCGRLLCCLSYEYGFYCEQQRLVPQEGTVIHYNGETWKVIEVNLVASQVKLSTDDSRMMTIPVCQLERADNHWRIKQCT